MKPIVIVFNCRQTLMNKLEQTTRPGQGYSKRDNSFNKFFPQAAVTGKEADGETLTRKPCSLAINSRRLFFRDRSINYFSKILGEAD